MIRKLSALVLILIMILSLTVVVNAETASKGEPPIFTLASGGDETKTFEPKLDISGVSKEGATITMYHYWYSAGQDESIIRMDADKNDEGGEWILTETPAVWEIGASGIFAQTIELKNGQNKIELVGKDKAGNKQVETLEIMLNDKTEFINNFILKDIDPNIK